MRYSFSMRWNVLLLLLFGCAAPEVKDIVFPAVAVDADGGVRGYLDREMLTTTNRQAIERYPGLRVIDSGGREWIVTAVKEIDPPGLLSDFAGTKPFQVAITLERGKRMTQSVAVALIAEAVRAKPGYLDLTVQGGPAVAEEIASKASVAEVAELLGVTYEPRKVAAEANARENKRVEDLAAQ